MKTRRTVFAAIMAAVVAATTAGAAETYTFDKVHSDVGFQIRHLVSKVRGRFTDYDGTIVVDKARPEASSVALTIKAASIDTGVADRDTHLRSGDFLEVEKYPELTFRSTRVTEPNGNGFTLVVKDGANGTTIYNYGLTALDVTFLDLSADSPRILATFPEALFMNSRISCLPGSPVRWGTLAFGPLGPASSS